MKKKIGIGLVLTLLCMCLLFACSEKKEEVEEESNGKATLSGIVVEVAEESRYAQYYQDGTFTLPEGVRAAFEKSDFVVMGLYGEEKRTVPAYQLTLEYFSPKIYYLQFIIAENIMAQFIVEISAETLPSVVTEGWSFEYSGEEIDILSYLSDADGALVADAIEEGKVIVDSSTVQKTADAGVFSLGLNATQGYVWMFDGEERDRVDILWEITPKVIPFPTVKDSVTYVYDGSEQVLELDKYGYDEMLSFTVGGVETDKATTAGTYFCQVQIKEEYRNNYTFDKEYAGSDEIRGCSWKIAPQPLPLPTLSQTVGEDGCYHFVYNGQPVLPTLSANSTVLTRSVGENGETIYSGADIYPEGVVQIVISAADEDKTSAERGLLYDGRGFYYHVIEAEIMDSNYCWEGVESLTYVIKYRIDRAEASLPADFEEKFRLKYIYSGEVDYIAGDRLRISPNAILKLYKEGTFAGSDRLTGRGFVMSEEVKSYLTATDIAIYENNDLPMDDFLQPIGFVGDNEEFSWAENATFGENHIAEVGKKYTLGLVFRKGSFSEGNYYPVTVNIEVEVIKSPLLFSFDTPCLYREDLTQISFQMEGAKLPYATDAQGGTIAYHILHNIAENVELDEPGLTTYFSADGGTKSPISTLFAVGFYTTVVELSYDKQNRFAVYFTYTGESEGIYTVRDTFSYDWEIEKVIFEVPEGAFDTATLAWNNNVILYDSYTKQVCHVETSAYAVLLMTRAGPTSAWTVMDINNYASAAGEYRMEITVGYDHACYTMVKAVYDEAVQGFKAEETDIYVCEWTIG